MTPRSGPKRRSSTFEIRCSRIGRSFPLLVTFDEGILYMASRRYASRAIFGLVVSFAAGLIVFQTLRSLARADDAADDAAKQEALERKERYTKWMRTYSEGTKIKVPEKNEAGTDG